MAEKVEKTAVNQAEKLKTNGQELLLGKSETLRNAENQSRFTEIRHQNRTVSDSANDAGRRLKGDTAEEFSA